jgi:hypothetical protein
MSIFLRHRARLFSETVGDCRRRSQSWRETGTPKEHPDPRQGAQTPTMGACCHDQREDQNGDGQQRQALRAE